jgi:hypothetical protein
MNPLLEKYEELHGKKEEPKKEEPKKEEPKVTGATVLTISDSPLALDKYMTTSSVTSGTASVSASYPYITAATHGVTSISSKLPRKFSCYDLDSVNDSFLQTADKIKTNKAQVISMEVTFDHSSSIRTVTFSVQVCDTP